MENQKNNRDTLMRSIMAEHTRLKRHYSRHSLLKYCLPFEDGIEWHERHMEEFYDQFRLEKKKKNGYSLVKEVLKPKKERKNGYTTAIEAKEVKTNYHSALRNVVDQIERIDRSN